MKLPHRFGKYVLVKKIANGGMAEIFRAKYYGERGFAKDVAVKRILPHWLDRKEFETMLVDEANALVHLQHQNIVQVFELGRDGEYLYISMEFVDGIDLRDLYKKTRKNNEITSEKNICFIIMEVLKGLEFAHRQRGDDGGFLNIVHRDVSPQNILISYNGEVKLTDFGIAKGLHRNQETTTAQLKGKYAYMSPEQVSGMKIDHRSDIYSVGIILFELLTGKRLFATGNDFETMERVRKSQMPEGWESMVTLGMRQILFRALAKDPSERYQCAADFIKDLDRYIALKRLNTHSLQFSDYINRLFQDEKNGLIQIKKPQSKKTKILPKKKMKMISKNISSLRKRYAAVALILISFLFLGAVRRNDLKKFHGVNINDINGKANRKEETLKEKVVEIPEIKFIEDGIVNIESNPSGVAGRLEYGGFVKNFTTPFVLKGIKIEEGKKGRIVLVKEGYGTLVDNFILDHDNPIVSKTYSLKTNEPARLSVQARPWGYVYVPGVISRRESPVSQVRVKPGTYKVKVHYAPTGSWATANVNVKSGQSKRCFADFRNGNKISCM